MPLIISCPSIFRKGLRSDALVGLVDIAPTLLEAIGQEVPYYMQGKSFLKILTGEADPHHFRDAVYAEYYHTLKGTHENINATMYFDGRYKLVCYHGESYGELYDLAADPDEFQNLWDDSAYQERKAALILKSYSNTVLCNMDESMHRVYSF